jgi:hypothetical protein
MLLPDFAAPNLPDIFNNLLKATNDIEGFLDSFICHNSPVTKSG